MTSIPVGSKFSERNLDDQFWRDPMNTTLLRGIGLDWCGLARKLLHCRGKTVHLLPVESSADLALVKKPAVLMLPKHQRSERTPPRLAFAPADDHELLPQCAFDLHPSLATRGAVFAVDFLGYDSFLPRVAHCAVKLLPCPDDMVGDVNGGRCVG